MLEAYKEKSSDNAKLRIDEDQLITGVAEKQIEIEHISNELMKFKEKYKEQKNKIRDQTDIINANA